MPRTPDTLHPSGIITITATQTTASTTGQRFVFDAAAWIGFDPAARLWECAGRGAQANDQASSITAGILLLHGEGDVLRDIGFSFGNTGRVVCPQVYPPGGNGPPKRH